MIIFLTGYNTLFKLKLFLSYSAFKIDKETYIGTFRYLNQ